MAQRPWRAFWIKHGWWRFGSFELCPVTIVKARYGGQLEGAAWLAFPVWPDELPAGWNGEPSDCVQFFSSYHEDSTERHPVSYPIGFGVSPAAAHKSLLRQCFAYDPPT